MLQFITRFPHGSNPQRGTSKFLSKGMPTCQELKEVLQKSLVRGASKVWMGWTVYFSCSIRWNIHTPLKNQANQTMKHEKQIKWMSFCKMKIDRYVYPETINFGVPVLSAEVLAEHRGHRMNRERFRRKANDEERNGISNNDTSRFSFPQFVVVWGNLRNFLDRKSVV